MEPILDHASAVTLDPKQVVHSPYAGIHATIVTMAHFILILIGAAVVGVIGFGVTWLIAGRDQGLSSIEPDETAVPLPTARPLAENDVARLRFDTTMRGYRMGQVDAALRRAAYDIGYKQELIDVLEAENEALRDGRVADADVLWEARSAATVEGADVAPRRVASAPGADPEPPADASEGSDADATDADATDADATDADATDADLRTDAHADGDSTAEHVRERDEPDMTKIDTDAVLAEFDPSRQASAGRAK